MTETIIEPRIMQVNKQDVARSFSLAAPTYDQVAALQRQVGETLLGRIPGKDYACIVDLGCGTGCFTRQLEQQLNNDRVIGVDIAQGMLNFARQKCASAALGWCCGDAEQLPLRDACVDLLFSSLAVQWCDDFQQVCSEAMRVLKPGGRFVLATLGPNTLHELRSAWQQVDGFVHVNRFIPAQAVTQAATVAGLSWQLEQQDIVMTYRELRDLTGELKALGAHNVNTGRPLGLTGKQRVQQLKAGYETFRNEQGLLPATYEVYYLVMEKPQ